MELSSSDGRKRQRTSTEPESSRDTENSAGPSRIIPAENTDGLAPTGVLRRSLCQKSKRFEPYVFQVGNTSLVELSSIFIYHKLIL